MLLINEAVKGVNACCRELALVIYHAQILTNEIPPLTVSGNKVWN